jgi:predicted metal-dependent HD superfamily phosphohydrolase
VPRCAAAGAQRHWAPVSEEVELRIAWSSIAPQTARSDEIFDDLVGRHRQPHRRYHGLRHVVWVLRHARRLEAAIPECHDGSAVYDAGVVTAAACFHDAVYDPRAGDNEERSALLAENRLRALDWTAPRCDLVAQLVRATAGYLADDDLADDDLADNDLANNDLANNDLANNDLANNVGAGHAAPWEQQVLLDADLAVLGAEPAAYAAYVSGVRSEYGHLSGAEWAAGRSRVLERLLARTYLFATQPATSWWDERARANLVAELASLRGGVRGRG